MLSYDKIPAHVGVIMDGNGKMGRAARSSPDRGAQKGSGEGKRDYYSGN